MNKTWFCYVALSIGLMLLVGADENVSAKDTKTSRAVSFGTEQKVDISVTREGDSEATVELIVGGENFSFTMPDLADGEDHTIITKDGQKIYVKTIGRGNSMFVIDGKEVKIPSFGMREMSPDGLSAMISSTHTMRFSDNISLSAHGLSEDVKTAILEAIEGILISYDVDKKVSFRDNTFGVHMLNGGTFEAKGDHTRVMFDINSKVDLIDGEGHVRVFELKVDDEEIHPDN